MLPLSEVRITASLDDFNQPDIYVLDTETTGLKGAPEDVVVDIGICRVNLGTGKVEEVYQSTLGYDVSRWNAYRRNAWIFENTDMSLEMVAASPRADDVIGEVRGILRGKVVTTFNMEYDLDKFLYLQPWSLRGTFTEATDIMKAATPVCKQPSMFEGCRYRYPKLDFAYEKIVKGDPAGIHGAQTHRAMSDAVMAAYIMIQLYRDGSYVPFRP